MKIQIIKCKTCNRTFAACIDKYADADWYKDSAKYMKTDNVIIETIESDGQVFDDSPKNSCCGKKLKQVLANRLDINLFL